MPSKKTAREEYLRRRYFKFGQTGLTPRDSLELLLGYCYSGQELYRVMDSLFDRFGSVDNIINAECGDLLEVSGMTESSAVLLSIMPKLHRLNSFARTASSRISDPISACEYFTEIFRGVNVEQFKIACLDDSFVVRKCMTAAKGTTSGVGINIDSLLKDVIKTGCRICVVAHNHPGGSCMPSEADIASTRRLISAFREAGIDVVDHIVLGRNGARSMLGQND